MTYVIVSGIPGSGKSTLAKRLAQAMDLPVLDKDDILDGLFESLGIGDAEWRSRLSRSADEIFRRVAPALRSAILVSWWRHPSSATTSGTPIHWLSEISTGIIEVHCVCPPDLAAARFAGRVRHAGHLDAARSFAATIEEFNALALAGPVGGFPVIRVATDATVHIDDLVASVRSRWSSQVPRPHGRAGSEPPPAHP